MAVPLLTRAVLQQITQRVLSNVLEQLPERLTQRKGNAQPAPDQLGPLNALAIGELQGDLRQVESGLDRVQRRMTRLERKLGWRAYARLVLSSLLTFALGFAVAVIVRALGWVG
jgi:hypothetical protein